MNAGVTSERVYEALKARLLGGTMLPGARLEPKKLAALLASSVTPVRDALHRLAGEHIVEMRAAEGFQLPLVTEPGLRELLHWNHELLRLALRRWPATPAASAAPAEPPPDEGNADHIRPLFAATAARSGFAELARQVETASDRLAVARIAERHAIAVAPAELADMSSTFARGDAASLARQIAAYHRRRLAHVPAIVDAIYRGR